MTQVAESWWRSDVVQAALAAYRRRYADMVHQGLWNNLFSNNPFELDRWADDGGKVKDAQERHSP